MCCIGRTSTWQVTEPISKITAGPGRQATDVEALLTLLPVCRAVVLRTPMFEQFKFIEAVSAT
jgi:hypothetical protein